MALPTYQTQSAKAAGTGAVTPALPSGVAADDIVILVATTIAGGSVSITANGSIGTLTEITTGGLNVTGGEKLYVWWGRFSSGSTGPTVTPGSDHCCAATFNVRGCVTSGSPVEAFASGTETTSDTSYSFATGVSTSAADRLVFTVYSSGADSNTGQGGTPANTSLGSVTLRIEYNTNQGGGGGFVVASGTLAAAGTCGTWTDTMVSATPKAYISFALIPPTEQTYEEAVTLEMNAGVSNVGASIIGASIILGMNAGISQGSALTIQSSVSLAMNASQTQGEIADLLASLNLGMNPGIALASVAVISAALALQASMGHAHEGGASFEES